MFPLKERVPCCICHSPAEIYLPIRVIPQREAVEMDVSIVRCTNPACQHGYVLHISDPMTIAERIVALEKLWFIKNSVTARYADMKNFIRQTPNPAVYKETSRLLLAKEQPYPCKAFLKYKLVDQFPRYFEDVLRFGYMRLARENSACSEVMLTDTSDLVVNDVQK